jgi:hypothetical protein
MHARVLRCLLAAAAAMATLEAVPSETGVAPRCEWPATDGHPMADRAGTLARYQRLPRACLQDLFAACSQATSRTLLDPGSAAVCSYGYEALLQQGFDGSFPALLAWWRSQRAPSLQ